METLPNVLNTGSTSGLPDVTRFRFRLEAIEPIRLPPFPGSALRGALGNGLRRTACVTRQPVCDGCLLRATCVYSTLFESPALDGGMDRRYAQLPHPFVLDLAFVPRQEIAAGARFELGINLIGPALAQAPYLIHALQLAGKRGLGRGCGQFQVAALERELTLGMGDWVVVYTPESGEYTSAVSSDQPPPCRATESMAAQLRFSTPLRIKRHGHLIGAAEFAPPDLLRALWERVGLIARHYGRDAPSVPWSQVRLQADAVRITHQGLHWQDWTRYSSRQDTLMQMGGLLGELHLAGPGLATFTQALDYGQWIHLGKGTSFGLGAYRLALA